MWKKHVSEIFCILSHDFLLRKSFLDFVETLFLNVTLLADNTERLALEDSVQLSLALFVTQILFNLSKERNQQLKLKRPNIAKRSTGKFQKVDTEIHTGKTWG